MIHYHGTPLYPADDMVKAFPGRHAMVSYADREQVALAAEICQSIALDNGAYSTWRTRQTYDLEGYVTWCRKWLKHPAVDWCVIPDVIDGTEAQNDSLVWSWPFPRQASVPVFHMHESVERLERLMGSFERIAIGSSGLWPDPGTTSWWKRMTHIMRVVCDAEGLPKVKLHGLRMLDPGIFSKLPLASADSCNVARNVGLDQRWRGPYVPSSRALRACILMERIERHATSSRWDPAVIAGYQNFELFG